MKKGSTKRALVTSIVSTCASVTMLAGATFAWFTDTASTGVNKIQAGTLDVALVDANGNSVEGRDLNWKTADNREQSAILWEPGATYDLETVKVVNEGNLAVKYKVVITGIDGDAELNEAIKWTINGEGINSESTLAANTSNEITISGTMKEDAGNEYQGKSIDGIAITVVATQDTVEKDSTRDDYDAAATYPAVYSPETNDDLESALDATDKNIVVNLTNDMNINVSDAYVTYGGEDTETITINGNGKTLTLDTTYWSRINTANPNAKLILNNVNITSTQKSGTWNSYDVTFMCNTVMNNVTFDKSVALDAIGKKIVMNNVKITEDKDYYALWIVGGTNATLEGCSITAKNGRGIKVCDQYAENKGETNLKVADTTFETAKKAAILVGSKDGANITLSNIDISNVVADRTNAVWVDSDYVNYASNVKVSGGTVVNE